MFNKQNNKKNIKQAMDIFRQLSNNIYVNYDSAYLIS